MHDAIPDDRNAADGKGVVLVAEGQGGLQTLRPEALKADLVELVQAVYPVHSYKE